MSTDRRNFLARAGAVLAGSGIAVLSQPKLVAASASEVSRYAVRAEDMPVDQQALLVSGRPAAVAAIGIEVQESSIDIEIASPYRPDLRIDEEINTLYSRGDAYVTFRISGQAKSVELAGFLNGIQQNLEEKGRGSRTTRLLVLKDWPAT